MVDVTIRKKNGSIFEVECDGHAGCGEVGEDIVCAGVSSLVNATLLGLMQVAGINIKFKADPEQANVRFTLPETMTECEKHDAQIILGTMVAGIQSLYSEYSDFINLEVI